jgi:hypothetical protein
MSAIIARSAIPAIAQGSAPAKPRCSVGRSAPAGVPQRWQNFAPAVSGAPHAAQFAAASVAPQLEQNFPEAAVWQEGQSTVADGAPSGGVECEGGSGVELIS